MPVPVAGKGLGDRPDPPGRRPHGPRARRRQPSASAPNRHRSVCLTESGFGCHGAALPCSRGSRRRRHSLRPSRRRGARRRGGAGQGAAAAGAGHGRRGLELRRAAARRLLAAGDWAGRGSPTSSSSRRSGWPRCWPPTCSSTGGRSPTRCSARRCGGRWPRSRVRSPRWPATTPRRRPSPRLYGELSHVSEATLATLEAGGRPVAAPSPSSGRVAARLGRVHGEDDLVRAAAGRDDLTSTRRWRRSGHLVWYLPEPVTPALAGLLRRRPARRAVDGHRRASPARPTPTSAVLAACRRAGVEVPAAEIDGIEPPVGVADRVGHRRRRGGPGRRPRASPGWPRTASASTASACSTPCPTPTCTRSSSSWPPPASRPTGRRRERLADSVAGRTLLAALALPGRAVAAGPGHGPGRRRARPPRRRARRARRRGSGCPARPASSRASATGTRKLDGLLAKRSSTEIAGDRSRGAARPDGVPASGSGTTPSPSAAFVDDLAAAVAAWTPPGAGPAKADAARRAPPPSPRRTTTGGRAWPDPRSRRRRTGRRRPRPAGRPRRARARPVRRTCSAGRSPPSSTSPGAGTGASATASSTGRWRGAAGHDLDAVFIVGLTEGQCPAPRRDDALLPDAARALRRRRGARLGRVAASATSTGPSSPPWPPPRRAGGSSPSPGATCAAGATSCRPAGCSTPPAPWPGTPSTAPTSPPSAPRSSTWSPPTGPASAAGRGPGVAARPGPRRPQPPTSTPAATRPPTRPRPTSRPRAFACIAARRSPDFTEWDGNLAGLPVPATASGDAALRQPAARRGPPAGSATSSAACSASASRDDPERIIELGALDRGSAVHEILEKFFAGGHRRRRARPRRRRGRPPQRARLRAIADEVFDELERTRPHRPGRCTGGSSGERLALLLDEFLTADDAYRADHRLDPGPGRAAVRDEGRPARRASTCPTGGPSRFRGTADRVDATADGRHLVTDYKTRQGRRVRQDRRRRPHHRPAPPCSSASTPRPPSSSSAPPSAEAHYWMVNAEVPASPGWATGGTPSAGAVRRRGRPPSSTASRGACSRPCRASGTRWRSTTRELHATATSTSVCPGTGASSPRPRPPPPSWRSATCSTAPAAEARRP